MPEPPADAPLDTAYRVTLPYATFALVARGGRIHRAPPIARRALAFVLPEYCRERGIREKATAYVA